FITDSESILLRWRCMRSLNPLKVIYSHDIFSSQFVGGISRYIFELYRQNPNAIIPLFYSENLYLGKHSKKRYFKGKNRIIWYLNESIERYMLKKGDFSIYHLSYYKHFIKPKNALVVVSVYDMIHEIYAHSYFKHDTKTSSLKALNCTQADGIIAISHQTKKDIVRFLHIPPHKIKVIYLGQSLEKKDTKIALPDFYVLFVGNRTGYKNFNTFAKAIKILVEKYPHIQALCVGSHFDGDEKKFLDSLGVTSHFISYGAQDDELYSLYANAICFVFPSLYEGFGIPILESFFAHCPAILSDIEVFREIAQDCALYFDPHNPKALASQIELILNDTQLKQSLVALADKRLEDFSWKKTYEQTLAFYKELMEQKSINQQESKMKKALIIGAGGQDGYFLMKLLLSKNYEVHIMVRHLPQFKHLTFVQYDDLYFTNAHNKIIFHYGDITDSSSIIEILQKVKPNEIYNLAGISNVKKSFSMPQNTADSIALGTLRILETIRSTGISCKFYNAASSEIFGNAKGIQNENTPFDPKSPYAIAKLYALYMVRHYREAYDIFAVNGILFNHESPLRSDEFVSKKIVKAAVAISYNLQEKLYLGNLNSKRDFGYAKDYVECMFLMLQYERAEDFIIATGEQHSIKEFCEIAFRKVGIELEWFGKGINEKGRDKQSKKILIEINPNYFRPLDIASSIGDSSKAQEKLGWNPKNTSFEQLIEIMIESEKVKQLSGGGGSV
uniref:GDP-mannose 4,6-dehydratase n=1 Tax=Helicobacter typhlonius TaxID=76936 RepID=UPI002FE1069D